MKGFLGASCLLIAGAAQAQTYPTVTLLQVPAAIKTTRTYCEGQSFNADDSVHGTCEVIVSSACSGRGCQPVTYTTFYIADWDLAGNPTLEDRCAQVRHHLPQANQWTFFNGHTAADCPAPSFGTSTTVGIPYGAYSWDVAYYYYVTTSADGAYEIVNLQSTSYVVAF